MDNTTIKKYIIPDKSIILIITSGCMSKGEFTTKIRNPLYQKP